MNRVVLITHFCGDFDADNNNRFNYLAGLLAAEGFAVELVTSGFSHTKKAARDRRGTEGLGYEVTFIPEPAYTKNVSLGRFYSHFVMGRNLRAYLNTMQPADLIYCATPSLDAASAAARYCTARHTPLVIDVQDLWPEAFRMVADAAVLTPVYRLMQRRADKIYAAADAIVAVSDSYATRALRVNAKCGKTHSVVYLGTDLAAFDALAARHNVADKSADEIWLAYAGTLGHSYDLTTVIDALAMVKSHRVKLIVLGDGPLKQQFEAHAHAAGIQAVFAGRLGYGRMCGMLAACDLAVNPISRGAAQSIINKHADYAAAGLPVLNTQESPEYAALVTEYGMGLNCRNNDARDLADKLVQLCADAGLRAQMSQNSRRLAEERFDRGRTYRGIVGVIRSLLK